MKLILNDFTVSVAFKLKEFLVLAQKRYFNWCFTVFHLYIALSVFHLATTLFYQIEVSFEIAFHLLNLIRLALFPLILVAVISSLFPTSFLMDGLASEATSKVVTQITAQLIEFLKDCGNIKKNPRGSALIYTGIGAGLIASAHRTHLQNQFAHTTKKYNLDISEYPAELAGDQEAKVLYQSLLKTVSEIDQSSLSVLASDVIKFLTLNPTLRTRLANDLSSYQAAFALSKAKKQQTLEKADDLRMSPLARNSVDSEIDTPSSAISKIPTILEKLFFDS